MTDADAKAEWLRLIGVIGKTFRDHPDGKARILEAIVDFVGPRMVHELTRSAHQPIPDGYSAIGPRLWGRREFRMLTESK